MNAIHHEYWECPLVGKKISDTTCMEFCDAVDGLLVMSTIDDYTGTRSEAEVVCWKCPHGLAYRSDH